MKPLSTFISKIRRRHALTVLGVTMMFIAVNYMVADPRMPFAAHLDRVVLTLVGVPVMLFTLAFLVLVIPDRTFGKAELFPSVMLTLSGFMAVPIAGAKLDDPSTPLAIVIPLGLVASSAMTGLILTFRFMFPKMDRKR